MEHQENEFVDIARAYLHLIDELGEESVSNCWQGLSDVLARLYAASLRLPEGDEGLTESGLAKRQDDHVYRRLLRLFGNYNTYRKVFNSYTDLAAVDASLADDLCDIYWGVKTSLKCYEQGRMDVALSNWKFGMESHWGWHITSAIHALFWIMYNNRLDSL